MSDLEVISHSGRRVFQFRSDEESSIAAFWIRVNFHPGVDDADFERAKVDLDRSLNSRELVGEGGEFGMWHWQLLVSATKERDPADAVDRTAVVEWLGSNPNVESFDAGPVAPDEEINAELFEGFRDMGRRVADKEFGPGDQ